MTGKLSPQDQHSQANGADNDIIGEFRDLLRSNSFTLMSDGELNTQIAESEANLRLARQVRAEGFDDHTARFEAEQRALMIELQGRTAVLLKASQVKPKKLTWLWPGRIPMGKITILDGDPGLGKSLLSIDLVAALTTAKPMPGCDDQRAEPAGAVLLSAEDDVEDTVLPRLALVGADLERVVMLTAVKREDGPSLPTIADLGPIAYAAKTVAAKLIVIDPLTAYLPVDTNSHRDQDIRRAMAPLAQLAADLNVAVLVIRHLNKTANNNPLYRGGGSIGIIGAARSGLMVAKDPDDESRCILSVAKSNLAKLAPSLAYEIISNPAEIPFVNWQGVTHHTAVSLLGAQAEDTEERSAVKDAEDFLREYLQGESRKAADVLKAARAAGVTEKTLRRAKHRLKVWSKRIEFKGEYFWGMPSDTDEHSWTANESMDGQK